MHDRPLESSNGTCLYSYKYLISKALAGARWWIRTTDPRRVKAVLYR